MMGRMGMGFRWVLGLALVAILACSGTASAITLEEGRFVAACKFSHESRNDPIVSPKKKNAAHLHHFFGNRSTNHKSTPRKLRKRKRSTCTQKDRSAYWVPALLINGKVVKPDILRAYYTTSGRDPRSIVAPPKGLKAIAGNAYASTPQPEWVTSWMCTNGPVSIVVVKWPSCREGTWLALSVNFPDCWDGENLDSPDHASHLAYASVPTLLDVYRTCPPTHPVPIPALRMRIIYPVAGATSNIELSSGGVFSAHADFMNGWPVKQMQALIDNCLRPAKRCRG